MCSAVRLAQIELYPFDLIAIGFEPNFFRTASHTLLLAWRPTCRMAPPCDKALVAPPPGANHVHAFPAVANTKDSLAGHTASCQPKRAVCSAVRLAQVELDLFDHSAIGFEPLILMTASHTLLRPKSLYDSRLQTIVCLLGVGK